MSGAALLARRRAEAAKAQPIEFEARILWKNVGQPEDGYLLSIGKELGLQAGDPVKVTIERIKNMSAISPVTALEHGLSLFRGNQPEGTTAVLEFGVYRGDSLRKIAAYVKDHGLQHVIVAGFDSFEGLPHDWPNTVCKAGFFSTDGEIPEVPGTAIYPGWFIDTLHQYEADFPNLPIGLLHLDADLYSSTITVLVRLNHVIKPGTIIVCDEWTYNFAEKRDDQEQRAFKEWLEMCEREAERIDFRDWTYEPNGNHDVGGERAIFRVTR